MLDICVPAVIVENPVIVVPGVNEFCAVMATTLSEIVCAKYVCDTPDVSVTVDTIVPDVVPPDADVGPTSILSLIHI